MQTIENNDGRGEKGKASLQHSKTGWNVRNYLNFQGKIRLLSPQVSYYMN